VRGQAGEERNTGELLGDALRVWAGGDVGRHCAARLPHALALDEGLLAPGGVAWAAGSRATGGQLGCTWNTRFTSTDRPRRCSTSSSNWVTTRASPAASRRCAGLRMVRWRWDAATARLPRSLVRPST